MPMKTTNFLVLDFLRSERRQLSGKLDTLDHLIALMEAGNPAEQDNKKMAIDWVAEIISVMTTKQYWTKIEIVRAIAEKYQMATQAIKSRIEDSLYLNRDKFKKQKIEGKYQYSLADEIR